MGRNMIVEKDIAPPKRSSFYEKLLDKMEIGHSVFVTKDQYEPLRYRFRKRKWPMMVRSKTVDGVVGYRIWRI
tara:strand:+ start:85 stop:303 length:219 start_codon:yes stop_codon:yes gene_type:complete